MIDNFSVSQFVRIGKLKEEIRISNIAITSYPGSLSDDAAKHSGCDTV